jgi:DNA-binding PadR family transcriptional regulator
MEVISGLSVKSDSITYIFEKSSEKIFKMQSGVIYAALVRLEV